MEQEARERRRWFDHERYMRNREERLAKQRAYYALHKEECKQAVRRSERKRREEILSGCRLW